MESQGATSLSTRSGVVSPSAPVPRARSRSNDVDGSPLPSSTGLSSNAREVREYRLSLSASRGEGRQLDGLMSSGGSSASSAGSGNGTNLFGGGSKMNGARADGLSLRLSSEPPHHDASILDEDEHEDHDEGHPVRRWEHEVESFRLFSRPRSVSVLVVLLAIVFYFAWRTQPDPRVYYDAQGRAIALNHATATRKAQQESSIGASSSIPKVAKQADEHEIETTNRAAQSIWNGYRGGCLLILTVAMVSFPDSPFTRPHPLVWRLVLGLCFIYWLTLVFVLFAEYQQVRAALAWLYPNELTPERWNPQPLPWVTLSFLDSPDYASDCSLTWKNLGEKFDVFVVCHFLGWAAKGLIIRNFTLCWIMSVFWEITEQFFAFILPNFSECWWDSWIADVLICNGLGIWFGIEVCKYFEVKSYDWHADTFWEGSKKSRVRRALVDMLRPRDWLRVRWDPLQTRKRYMVIIGMVLVNQIVELNAFIIKNIFEIPSPHKLNIYRLVFWALMCLPACRQVYMFAIDEAVVRLGTYAWFGLGTALTELLIGIKFGFCMSQPLAPWPIAKSLQVTSAWLVALCLFTTVWLYLSRALERSAVGQWWATKDLRLFAPKAKKSTNQPKRVASASTDGLRKNASSSGLKQE
ncbi:unnamed protein product [Amoebophrya sp. A25]|nr:unnamed protein product [Amoebophrya sp. A25]|eukprot:GSA25T00016203001.1